MPRFAEAVSQTPVHEARALLTPRQREILRLVADDLTNEEIAAHLGLSVQTVKNALREACRRLGVRGRAGAVARAYRLGILTLPDTPARLRRSQR